MALIGRRAGRVLGTDAARVMVLFLPESAVAGARRPNRRFPPFADIYTEVYPGPEGGRHDHAPH